MLSFMFQVFIMDQNSKLNVFQKPTLYVRTIKQLHIVMNYNNYAACAVAEWLKRLTVVLSVASSNPAVHLNLIFFLNIHNFIYYRYFKLSSISIIC